MNGGQLLHIASLVRRQMHPLLITLKQQHPPRPIAPELVVWFPDSVRVWAFWAYSIVNGLELPYSASVCGYKGQTYGSRIVSGPFCWPQFEQYCSPDR